MKCEVHKDCEDEVVAKVGLPGPNALWACKRGFDEFQAGILELDNHPGDGYSDTDS